MWTLWNKIYLIESRVLKILWSEVWKGGFQLIHTPLKLWPLFKRSIFQTLWRLHCCPGFLLIELDTSNFGYLLIFLFCWTVQSLRKTGQHLHYTFYKGPPLMFFVFVIYQKFKGGDPCKMCNINVVQSFPKFTLFSKI